MLGFQSLVVSYLGVLACVASGVNAAQAGNSFINPAPLSGSLTTGSTSISTYQIGQVLNITWKSTYSSVDLVIWQQAVDGSSKRIFQGRTSGSPYLWTIDVDTFQTEGVNSTTGVAKNIFNLVLYQSGNADGSQAFSSQYFNLTNAVSNNALPTTTYASATVAGAFVTVTATNTANSGSNGASNSYGYASDSTNDNNGMRLGLGLGLGLGIPLLVTVAALAYLLGRRRSRHHDAPQAPQMAPAGRSPAPGFAGSGVAGATQTTPQQPQRPALVEHYGSSSWDQGHGQVQSAPGQNQIPMQPIVTAKYQ